MADKITTSIEILKQADSFQPYARILLLSGGNDSMTALQVCRSLKYPIDAIIHLNTRTGIPETTEFVRNFVEAIAIKYIEGDAGDTYINRVMSRGFIGKGVRAHGFAYHLLKKQWLDKIISTYFRQRKRDRRILLINGARHSESLNRSKNLINPIKQDKNNIWVNVIHYWEKSDCRTFLSEQKCPLNPVSELLCRSGECMCGTTQSKQARQEAAYWFPEWGKWLDSLEAQVKTQFPWGWGEDIPQSWILEKYHGQLNLFNQPNPTQSGFFDSPTLLRADSLFWLYPGYPRQISRLKTLRNIFLSHFFPLPDRNPLAV